MTAGPSRPDTPVPAHALPEMLRNALAEFAILARRTDEDPTGVIVDVTELVERLGEPSTEFAVRVRLFASSVVINAAMVCGDVAALELGSQWATAAIDHPGLSASDLLSAEYNRANALSTVVKIRVDHCQRAQPELGWPAAYRNARWADRDLLATVRAGFHAYATQFPDAEQRSMGWCNLANEFDHSGRWLEAYDAYVAALAADPSNGNAAGNAARLIRQVADSGWGYSDHLHGLHDNYLAEARALRDRTVEIAGEHAARLYDAMTPYGCESATLHAPQSDDPYQVWVARHRLALAPALEGLGANEDHWDSVMIASVTTPVDQAEGPMIFRMLNLLKADYLAARRMAYRAEQMLEESPYGQHVSDPGRYVDTLDFALYGEAAATLLLAQRSALDTLDKIAVAVNEHLGLGDNPRRINFREFWTTKSGDQIRPELLSHDTIAFLALAELARDLDKDGLYVKAQDLRNAATHRFPLVHQGFHEIDATDALLPVIVDEAVATTRHALAVARSAYLYVVATLDMIEKRKQRRLTLPVHLPDQAKSSRIEPST